MNNLVELANVVKVYQRGTESLPAVDGVTLTIEAGEMLAVVGPSGSGKSTLLHLIGCMERPTQGQVILAGIETSTRREKDLARIRNTLIGFVFQQFFLLPTLTAWENVLLPTLFHPQPMVLDNARRAKELLSLVGLADRADHRPSQLSGGEMQRVAIARALVNDPKLLLADEPTGSLDSRNAKGVFELLRNLHRQGLTILVVTHNEELAAMASRRLHMKDGRIGDGAH